MSDDTKQTPPRVILGPLATDLPFMIRNLHALLRSAGSAVRDPLELETGSIGILSLIWVNPGISQNNLAANLAMKKSAIAKLVKSLEAQGLVERTRIEGDRRVNAITLTADGHRMVAKIRALSVPLNENMLEGIDAREAEVFFRVLEKLHASLASKVSMNPGPRD